MTGSPTRRLQVEELLLLLHDRRLETLERGAPRLVRFDLVLHPAQVGFLAGEFLDEVLARHLRLVDRKLHDVALVGAHFVDQPAHAVAQRLDLLRGEADVHELVGDVVARLKVRLAARAFLLQRLHHLAVVVADHGEALERLFLQLQHVGALHRGAVFVFLFVAVEVFVVFLRGRFDFGCHHLVFIRVRIDEAVDDFIDAHLVFLDPLGETQDLRDRGRARRDRLDHVLQAVLDALGDLDLALAREKLDRAHLAHVHAHRIGGAAELGIDGRQRRFGLFDRGFVGDGGRHLRHEQRFGIRAPRRTPGCPCR